MKEKLAQAFGQLLDTSIAATPKVALGLILFLGGLLAAKLVEVSLRFVLRRIMFDALVGKAGIDQILHRLGIREQLSIFLPRLVYFLVLIVLAQTSADAIGLTTISGAISAFFVYLPNIIAAILLLIIGSTLGQFAGQTVQQSAESSGIDVAPALGRLVSGGIFFVCAMMAVGQLKIDTAIVRIVTSIILGGAALAFGISFGFGTRDVVRNIAAGFYARKVLEIGRPLTVSGHTGTLRAITATHILLDSEDGEISIANSAVLHQVTRQQ